MQATKSTASLHFGHILSSALYSAGYRFRPLFRNPQRGFSSCTPSPLDKLCHSVKTKAISKKRAEKLPSLLSPLYQVLYQTAKLVRQRGQSLAGAVSANNCDYAGSLGPNHTVIHSAIRLGTAGGSERCSGGPELGRSRGRSNDRG